MEGRGRGTASSEPQSAIRNPRFVLVVLSLLVFAGIPFALGKYFEFSVPDAFDGGSYAYSANHLLSGARIGHEEKPSAQAGTLLVNMLGVKLSGFNETGAEVIQMLLQAAALTVMFITVRRLYGTLAAVVSVTVASIYLSAPLIAKFGNVKEQFMIAFMILGICTFVFYQLHRKWWWAVLAGALLVWGPMFKQTGISAVAAAGLFLLVQVLWHRYPWRKAGKDLLLLGAGAVLVLTPIVAWYVSMDAPTLYWPYSFIYEPVLSKIRPDQGQTAGVEQPQVQEAAPARGTERGLILRLLPSYVSDSWEILDSAGRKEAFLRVLRYYGVLILPVALGLGAILSRAVVLLRNRRKGPETPIDQDTGRFVPLFAVWWFFDMAFVWISPHSYEQYYLPLNASSAVLGGYFVGLYAHRLRADRDRARWVVLGLAGLLAMIVLSWHVFFGITKSPHSGAVYRDPRTQRPIRTRGYLQKYREVVRHPQYDWLRVGDYIREHSDPADPIYVWGWVPGIYVRAQRMSAMPKAFEGLMHTLPPEELARRVQEIVQVFEKNPPKYIVDTRKDHFPFNRPPLELWPIAAFSGGKVAFLSADEGVMEAYDRMWAASLREGFGPDEARRYEAVAPLRKYVIENYKAVEPQGYRAAKTRFGLPTLYHEAFGIHTVFVRK
jgi:4-amino-4-deoxy-L-arabinose transferase-like glycosyltransferase